jgi:hypothetical protein
MRTPIAHVPAHRSTHTQTHIDRTTPRCIVGHAHDCKHTDIHGCAFKGVLASMYARIDSHVLRLYVSRKRRLRYKFTLTPRARPCKRPRRRTNAHAGPCARRQTYMPMDASKRTRRFLFFPKGICTRTRLRAHCACECEHAGACEHARARAHTPGVTSTHRSLHRRI